MLKKSLSKASYQVAFFGYNFLPIITWKLLSNPATEMLAFLNNYQIYKNITYLSINNYSRKIKKPFFKATCSITLIAPDS